MANILGRPSTILVTGATGNVGKALVARLRARGHVVRAVTRQIEGRATLAGVQLIQGDPSRPDTLVSAFQDVRAVFVNPMATQGATAKWLALARAAGVARVVALSAINVDDDPASQPSRLRGVNHQEIEQSIADCGLEWVALRTSPHASNARALWSAQLRAGDVVRGTYAASTAAPIHERDIAEVAAEALITPALVGQRPVLTGPESLTQEQMVLTIGEMLGRPVDYVEIDPGAAKRVMLERGFPFPPELIDRLHALLANAVGHPAETTRTIEEILGRPALTFASWVREHAEDFRRVPSAAVGS